MTEILADCVNCGKQVILDNRETTCYWCYKPAFKKVEEEKSMTGVPIKELDPDTLCLVGLALITAFWILEGKSVINLPEEVIGATIVTWALLFNFYFRRAKPNGNGNAQ